MKIELNPNNFIWIEDGFYVFSFLGLWLNIKDTKRNGLTFSEREGLTKFAKIGRWRIKFRGWK